MATPAYIRLVPVKLYLTGTYIYIGYKAVIYYGKGVPWISNYRPVGYGNYMKKGVGGYGSAPLRQVYESGGGVWVPEADSLADNSMAA